MTAYILTEYRTRDGSKIINEADATTSLRDVVTNAANGWDILSITMIEITPSGVTATDLSKDAAKLVIELYGDDEGGITDEWDTLFHRAGLNLEAINEEAAADRYSPAEHSTLNHSQQGISR